jgi:hypothetical protein
MHYYSRGMGLGIDSLGQAADAVTSPNAGANAVTAEYATMGPLRKVAMVVGFAAVPALAYHGFKRNDSAGWAVVWGLFGSMVWPITVPIAIAQGYAKPSVRKNRRRTSRSR